MFISLTASAIDFKETFVSGRVKKVPIGTYGDESVKTVTLGLSLKPSIPVSALSLFPQVYWRGFVGPPTSSIQLLLILACREA